MGSHRAGRGERNPASARDRILERAYQLFSRQGIRAVGIDTVVAESDVAKMTLYRHFPSKDDLVLAFLDRREELWTRNWLQAETEHRAISPGERLLAIFDLFDEWFRREDFEGCPFINVLLEITDPAHVVHMAAVRHLANVQAFVRGLAEEAGVRDPTTFARQWHTLMNGAIVAAAAGDPEAAVAAREAARLLFAHERVARELGGDETVSRPPRSRRRAVAS